MVGIFSWLSVGRAAHRRTQSALDDMEALPPNAELTCTETVASTVAPHGIQVMTEFKPVDHPIEPLDNDQPFQCPVSEPSILNDGRIWKERVSATVRRRNDLPPVMREDGVGTGTPEPESAASHRRMRSSNRLILLPSASAPEHNLIKLLEECNASGI